VPAGALLAAVAWWFVSRSSRVAEKLRPLDDLAKQRRLYLVIAAFVQLIFWPATLGNAGMAGYLIRVLAAALTAAPFLAGRDSRGDRGLASLWCLTILVNGVVGIATGSRSKALITVVLFAAGYISALPRNRRLAVGAFAALATIPLVQFSGAAGIVRDELGRDDPRLLQPEHLREVFYRLVVELTPGNQRNVEELNLQGAGRMLAWTNVVVPLMTPETIPYRGLDEFLDEAAQSFRIASVSGLTADDLLDAGLNVEPARLYGFTINSNTSVEFTLAADAWSRGGGPVAILFSFIAALALTFGEFAACRLHRYGTGVATILALPAAKAAFFDANIFPLLPTLRIMFLNLFVLAALTVVVELARFPNRGLGRRRMVTASGPARFG
jgi:hypothetical protein